MKSRLVLPLIGVLALAGCKWESPTDPSQRIRAAASDPPVIFTLTPEVIVLRPGESRTATIHAAWPYPLGVEFFSADQSVVLISGRIPPGQAEGTVLITGVSEGRSPVWISIPNFARPPGAAQTGTILVTTTPSRRRSVKQQP